MNYYKKTEYLLYNYKMLEISIENMQQEIEYLKDNDGMTGLRYDGVSISKTNKTSNPTEVAALSNSEQIHYLEHSIARNKRLVESIDRAMEVLEENERTILKYKYIENKQWWQVAAIVRYGERHCRNIRKNAIEKMATGIFGKSSV